MTGEKKIEGDNILNQSKIAEALRMIVQGKVPQIEMGVSDGAMAKRYEVGCSLLSEGKCVEAAAIFSRLAALNPGDKSYWLSLGAAEIQAKRYEASLTALAMATVVDPQDPKPHHYAGLCNLALERDLAAKQCFELAQKLSPANSELARSAAQWLQELT